MTGTSRTMRCTRSCWVRVPSLRSSGTTLTTIADVWYLGEMAAFYREDLKIQEMQGLSITLLPVTPRLPTVESGVASGTGVAWNWMGYGKLNWPNIEMASRSRRRTLSCPIWYSISLITAESTMPAGITHAHLVGIHPDGSRKIVKTASVYNDDSWPHTGPTTLTETIASIIAWFNADGTHQGRWVSVSTSSTPTTSALHTRW